MPFEIVKPSETSEGIDVILYGPPKVGKTSTLDDENFKVLIIDLEGGSAVLSEATNVDRIPVNDYETLIEVFKAIENGDLIGYDLYATDSLTQFEVLVKDYVARKYAPNRKREIQGKFGAMADWGDLRDLITKTVKWIHGLTKRGDNSIHHMWIAHVVEEKDEITKQITRTKIAIQGGNTADVVMSIVDAVFYMYNKSIPSEDGKSVEIERGILTKPAGYFVANARQSKKRDPLPAKIVSPVWSEIFEQLGYVRK
jgi:hypothetical protein